MRKLIARAALAAYRWAAQPAFVMIYDTTDNLGDDPQEEYYGYFSTPDGARERFEEMADGSPFYTNARVCMMIEPLNPMDEGQPLSNGAYAVLEAFTEGLARRDCLTALMGLGMTRDAAEDAIEAVRDRRWHGYTPESCPYKHNNDGADYCSACGENLQ